MNIFEFVNYFHKAMELYNQKYEANLTYDDINNILDSSDEEGDRILWELRKIVDELRKK